MNSVVYRPILRGRRWSGMRIASYIHTAVVECQSNTNGLLPGTFVHGPAARGHPLHRVLSGWPADEF